MLKYFRLVLVLAIGLGLASVSAAQTKHSIKASSRPYKAVGHAVKSAAKGVVRASATATTATAVFSFAAFDAAVIDPFGVALQALADGLDLAIAQPLEALPNPLNKAGVVVHYVYLGLDKAGEVLAR